MKVKLCILVGGGSCEREVSFRSKENILKAIDENKYDINVIEVPKNKDKAWIRELMDISPDIVLSALHGGEGENGAVQGLLECLDIKYLGSDVLSSALCMDKFVSKAIMKANYIPVAEDVLIKEKEEALKYKEDIREIGFPVVVKPNRGGSSLGISIVNSFDELEEGVKAARKIDTEILVEKYIEGREITCGVIETENGLEVLSVLDITTENRSFYDYSAKYEDEKTKIGFSTLPEFQQTMIKEIAKKAFSVLKCKGYGIVDMIVKEEQVYVIELNTLPGLTQHSLIPKTAEVSGLGFAGFLDRLIKFELER